MHAVILGFTVSKEMMNEVLPLDPNLSLQTYRFAWNLTSALQIAGLDVSLISAVPVTNYPGTKKLIFKSRRFFQSNASGVSLFFINFVVLKHITRLFSGIKNVISLNKKKRINYLFIHGIHSPFLVVGFLARFIGCRTIVVLTDPPNVIYPTDDFLSRLIKKADGLFISFLIKKMDGSICLSEHIAQDMVEGKPSIVIPGFFNTSLLNYATQINKFDSCKPLLIAYAGALDERYGIANLAKAVVEITEFPIVLHLYGKGDLKNRFLNEDFGKKVVYKGVLPQDVLYDQLIKSDLIVNPRPNSEVFTKYSFPSKIIETLALGIPLMSTVLDGMPEQFFQYIWPIHDGSIKGLRQAIMEFQRSSAVERETKALKGRQFVNEKFSEEAQGLRISQFLQNQFE